MLHLNLIFFIQESSESQSSDAKSSAEPLVTNESHNPLLEASLEKALEEASTNGQTDFVNPAGKKRYLSVT